jgi:two-component system, NarL family, response regulator NreC
MTFRIVIVDDHEVIRAGLHALLDNESEIEVVGEAENSEVAIQMVEHLAPDIVLMDISMPGMNGIETTRKIKKKSPATQVLILTVHEDGELLYEGLKNGASGYILKRAVKSELINAIHAVGRGDLYVHSPMTRALLEKALNPLQSSSTNPPALTQREEQILRLIAKGYTNNQVGDELFISIRTVEFHRRNIMDKLGVDNRVELVKYAVEHGLG